ncbi:hypothetical protein [Cupriavidus sp. D39]|uniref:hypothetical protein n=1 Tax=Cupriavidus sp. D39 TaxID=2997877 RepID=UPI00226E9DB3|nr:hypothetical protein [Cupriavidus sp. D39]MCY0854836.1 hypothetical protein [Cupriavidus sp. D39]
MIKPALAALAFAFGSLSLIALSPGHSLSVVPVIVAVVVWGLSAWAFFPAQQARLIGIAGLPVAPVVLSLNASFMFAGFSLGAALGAFTLNHASFADLGWVGATCELAALLLLWLSFAKASAVTNSLPATSTANE